MKIIDVITSVSHQKWDNLSRLVVNVMRYSELILAELKLISCLFSCFQF